MHGLAQEIVATERERKVADATADVRSRKVSTYPSRGTDKVKCIGAVLGKSRTDGKYVGIEDDILRPDACFLRQKSIGTLADCDAAFERSGLSLFVEGHHNYCGSKRLQFPGMAKKLSLPSFEGDAVDDALALAAFQGGTDDFPSRRIDHEGNSSHLGVGSEKTQEMHHLAFGVKKTVVEVDVEHHGTILHLATGNGASLFV